MTVELGAVLLVLMAVACLAASAVLIYDAIWQVRDTRRDGALTPTMFVLALLFLAGAVVALYTLDRVYW